MLHLFAKAVLSRVFLFFWLFVFCPPVLLANWLIEHEPKLRLISMCVGGLYAFAWLCGSWLLGVSTANYMLDEHELLLTALKFALRDLRCQLSLLPVIGPWFAFKNDRQNHEDD